MVIYGFGGTPITCITECAFGRPAPPHPPPLINRDMVNANSADGISITRQLSNCVVVYLYFRDCSGRAGIWPTPRREFRANPIRTTFRPNRIYICRFNEDTWAPEILEHRIDIDSRRNAVRANRAPIVASSRRYLLYRLLFFLALYLVGGFDSFGAFSARMG